MPSAATRPENSGRRRSLALDRSEHDGRLAAVRDGVACAIMPVLMALPIALAMIVALPGLASADPPSSNRLADHSSVSVSSGPYAGFVADAAKRFAIPEHWIRAVMRVESRNDPAAISPKGAMGLMQIMPATWAELRVRHHLGDDAYDPRDNILAGAAYLAELHDLYGSPGFLAAYNAGPGRYEKHLVTGDPLPHETIDYMAKLVPMIDTEAAPIVRIAARSRRNEWADAPLFFVQRADVHQVKDGSADRRSKRSGNTTAIIDLSALAPGAADIFVQRVTDEERQQ
ncbi:lytic transglycosylase domain-containing protein [Ensifer sp. BR816]|uniref:lytic transglycosylase domain-containing protein n=1 Tax=Rhizobium sp. (strain BR816) TaxID=1057002 RepID=UPI0003A70E19|nr:lytic transglycosylase domain-containing protein [Ensifer sp. BR816]